MSEIMTYKERPLVRDKNRIYYGDPSNEVIAVLIILTNTTVNGAEVPSRILVQLQSTDPALALKPEKIINEAERKNLADALNLAALWLEKQGK